MLRHQPVMFTSWRIVHGFLLNRKTDLFRKEDYRWFLAAVTSHSTLGGGLDPLNPIPTRTPEEAYRLAIDLLKRFQVVTANSIILRDLLHPALPHVLYCPNGVDTNFFDLAPEPRKFDASEIRIGWVGKERGPKNFSVVKEALDQLEKSGGFQARVVRVDKELSKIPLTPEGMRAYYHDIDFYLCASWNEGTPNPALEAGACGVPVVTTRVGNMPELIIDGENGFFVDPTVDSIVKRFKTLCDLTAEQYSKISRTMRQCVEKDWSWPKRIENFVSAFDALLQSQT